MKIAISQASSTPDPEVNIQWVEESFQKAKENRSELIIFPECILSWAKNEETRKQARSLADWKKIFMPLIKKYEIASVWGGVQILEDKKIYNTMMAYDMAGNELGIYEKTHLFQLFIKDKITVDETQTYEFGRTGPVKFELNGFSFGMSICYDVRFPELYREYSGVDALICTAAFTKKTGRAHWETLLRARAIENQCYMLAAAQCGVNKLDGIQTYGHSMAIDPWGKVLAEAEDEPTVIFTELDKNKITTDRELLPALKNRRLK
ncbi:MAG: hypothetical protein NE327_02880 [Lentisphaeraceae bacterium]|nr:hypothetical protein [Lentisphaeraceae bacterium]